MAQPKTRAQLLKAIAQKEGASAAEVERLLGEGAKQNQLNASGSVKLSYIRDVWAAVSSPAPALPLGRASAQQVQTAQALIATGQAQIDAGAQLLAAPPRSSSRTASGRRRSRVGRSGSGPRRGMTKADQARRSARLGLGRVQRLDSQAAGKQIAAYNKRALAAGQPSVTGYTKWTVAKRRAFLNRAARAQAQGKWPKLRTTSSTSRASTAAARTSGTARSRSSSSSRMNKSQLKRARAITNAITHGWINVAKVGGTDVARWRNVPAKASLSGVAAKRDQLARFVTAYAKERTKRPAPPSTIKGIWLQARAAGLPLPGYFILPALGARVSIINESREPAFHTLSRTQQRSVLNALNKPGLARKLRGRGAPGKLTQATINRILGVAKKQKTALAA